MPNLNHLWQRFLLTSSLLIGLAIGVAATVFGYSNLGSVDIHWSVFHINGVPLWTVTVVPLALALIAGTLYHWMDGLHHFTEHMRHRRRVHELEAEVASLRAHLDQVLEMPDHSGKAVKSPARVSLPEADEMAPELAPLEEPAAVAALPEPRAEVKGGGDRKKRVKLFAAPEPKVEPANGEVTAPAVAAEPTEAAEPASQA
ncbi:MAG TPA: hypothetical protein VNP53_11910 [Methylomirabilota bacterium]|nr:hypothetical protein [Methylomirabilota bacterium]